MVGRTFSLQSFTEQYSQWSRYRAMTMVMQGQDLCAPLIFFNLVRLC